MDFGQYVFGAPYFEWLCRGVLMTIAVAVASGICAALVGWAVLRLQISDFGAARAAGVAYVLVFRNLPLVPLLLFLTFGVPGLWQQVFGATLPRGLEFPLLVVGLALNTAAYLAEIMRAGITAVETGQVEMCNVLGLTPRAARGRVIYPQAMRMMAPALTTRFIHNMKNSTLALVVPLPLGLMEVVGQAGRIAGQTFSWAEPLIFAACVHLALSLGLGGLLNHWAAKQQARFGLAS
jgi:His/Glu/Gln/Arg/opine family amino acid ABC transporter permease subunit